MPNVALVDDDPLMLDVLSAGLEAQGFLVRTYSDSQQALDALIFAPPDVAILDIKMPNVEGFQLLVRIRQASKVPVIFLTSRADEIDEAVALRAGADDYLRKPVSVRLLAERVRALLRRRNILLGPRDDNQPLITRGDLILDPARHKCSWKGQPLTLTVTQFLLIKCLAQRPGVLRDRHELLDAAYEGDRIYVSARAIDNHIKRLRAKFHAVDPDFASIETVYGIGYRFVVPASAEVSGETTSRRLSDS